MLSLVVPLYRSEANLDDLLPELVRLSAEIQIPIEVMFVIDGSPDRCGAILAEAAPGLPFACRVIDLSRNFGSFAAIAAGLQHGEGDYFAVLPADLQEPPELMLEFLRVLTTGSADIVFGARSTRSDPFLSSVTSKLFWRLYRATVAKDFPPGGVDIFACTRQVRDVVISLREVDSSLVGLLFWVGFRRAFVPYQRRPRTSGKSAWTLRKKIGYAMNSIFNFTDLPVRLLLTTGSFALVVAAGLGITVWLSRLFRLIEVPGYSATVTSVLFFGGVTSFGLGIVGQYVWITLQNVRNRPLFIIRSVDSYQPSARGASQRPTGTAPKTATVIASNGQDTQGNDV
jgi:glycosyltransferase involved in cell wall biosynthesis